MHWSHREVRRLLNYLSQPKKLECEPLAILLREATEAKSAQAAVTAIVDRALGGDGPTEKFMRSVVVNPDFGSMKSRGAAAALGLSARSYFRYRAAAIDQVAKEIDRELRARPRKTKYELQLAEMVSSFEPSVAFDSFSRAVDKPQGEIAYEMLLIALKADRPITREMVECCNGPWRALALTAIGRKYVMRGRPDAAARCRNRLRREPIELNTPVDHRAAFEIARFDRLRALLRCDIAAAREAMVRMAWHARSNSELASMALVVEVEQACDERDLERAAKGVEQLARSTAGSHDLQVLGRTAFAQSLLAFLQCRWDQAWSLGRLAATALFEVEPVVSIYAQANVARSALQLSKTWTSPPELKRRFQHSWIMAMIHAASSRHLLAVDSVAADRAAKAALRIADFQKAWGMLNYARATSALMFLLAGREAEGQATLVEAWETGVTLGCQSLLHDMFVHPAVADRDFGIFNRDAAFIAAVTRRGKNLWVAKTSACSPSQFALIQTVVHRMIGKKGSAGPKFAFRAPELARMTLDLAPKLAADLAICLPFKDREGFVTQFAGGIRPLGAPRTNVAQADAV